MNKRLTLVFVGLFVIPFSASAALSPDSSPSFTPAEEQGSASQIVDKPETALETKSNLDGKVPVQQKIAIGICNKAELASSKEDKKIVQFTARVLFLPGSKEAKVRSLEVTCDKVTNTAYAKVVLQLPPAAGVPLISLTTIKNLLKPPGTKELTKEIRTCKVTDQRATFVLNAERTEIKAYCGNDEGDKNNFNIDTSGNNTNFNNSDFNNGFNNQNNDGLSSQLSQSATEALAEQGFGQNDTPAQQGAPQGQGSYYNPYAYQEAAFGTTNENDLFEDEFLEEDEYDDGVYGGEIVDWRNDTGLESGKADSSDLYNPLLAGSTGDFSDDESLGAYSDSFYYDLPQDNSEGYINALLSGTGEGSGVLDYAVWEAEEKATRDGWTPLDVSYEEYREYYIGATLTRSQWDNWYKRLVNPVDFSYNPGLDSPSGSQSTGGFFSRGWAWLVSWFEETVPTGQYYEI